jgi:GAF domain-containing protein
LNDRLSELERLYPPPQDLQEGPYHILRNGGHHFVPRFTKEMLDAYAKDAQHRKLLEPLSGYICVPLQASGRIFGTLSLLGTSGEFNEEDLSLAQDLARWVALALDNARLYALARRQGK